MNIKYAIPLMTILLMTGNNVFALDCPTASDNSPTCNGDRCVAKRATYVEGDCFLGIPFLCSDSYWLYHTDQFECANSCNNGTCPAGQVCTGGLCEQDAASPPAPVPQGNWFCRTFGWFCP